MHDAEVWSKLKTILDGISAGKLNNPDKNQIEGFLAVNWDELARESDGGMQGYKVNGRTEEIEWQPPVLCFRVERHGRTVLDSSRAHMQKWKIDVDRCVAEPVPDGHRQLRKMNPILDIEGIAKEIAHLIIERREDPRLKWTSNDKVKVLSGKIVGGQSVSKETLAGRQKGLRRDILSIVEPRGWVANGSYYEFHDTGT